MNNADNAAPAAMVDPALIAAAAADRAESSQPAAVPGQPAAAPAAPAAADYDAESRDLVAFAWALFDPLYPSLRPIYTAEVRATIAARLAPIARKYGWTLEFFGPEIMLGVTLAPLIVPTARAIKADNAAARAAKAAPVKAAAAAVEVPPPPAAPLDQAFPGLSGDGEPKKKE